MSRAGSTPAAARPGARVPQPPPPVPTLRLSAFYLLHFAVVGCFMPFLGPWLSSLGYGAVVIGALTAVMAAGRIVAPPLWAWLADAMPARLPLMRGCLAGETLLFAVVAAMPASLLQAGEAGGAWLLAALLLGFSVCGSGVLPQFEVVTLNHLGGRPERYTVLRLWGSVGFVVAVMGLGVAVDAVGVRLWPWPVLGLLGTAVLLSLVLTERPAGAAVAVRGAGLGALLRRPEVWGLLLGCVLMQASHGTYYAFFSLYLERAGYDGTTIGALWALGVVAEVGLFAAMPWLARRVATRPLFLACFALTALRWLLTLGGGSPPVLALAQCLHAASFGLYHAVAIQCVHAWFRGPLQGRGQALYSSLGFGLGGAAGSFAAGLVWDAHGAGAAWLAAAATALAGLLVVWISGAGRLPRGASASGERAPAFR